MEGMSEIFSRVVRAAAIKDAPVHRHIEAEAPERVALAGLLSLPAIARLTGDFKLSHAGGGIIVADLHLSAELTQVCVITLEPFTARLDEQAGLHFMPASRLPEGGEPAELDTEALQGPDEIPYAGETIDLGAALAEQLALSLDPYPRKPGAALPPMADEDAAHPFAILAQRRLTASEDP